MLNIVMEDDNKIIVYKKAGQLSQSGKSFDLDLVSEVMTYRRKKGEPPYAAIINRLDRPVAGLVLIAKNQKEAARLSALMQKETLCKQYDAILCGKPEQNQETLVDYLLKDGKENVSAVVSQDAQGAKRAELRYEVVKRLSDKVCLKDAETITKETKVEGDLCDTAENSGDLTMVHIHLITGRHHQIRVQFSSRNLPLLGDVKYGGIPGTDTAQRYVGRNQIALCASSLTVDGKTYTVKPEWLNIIE